CLHDALPIDNAGMAKWLGPSTERAPRARPTRAVVAAVVVAMLAGAAAVTRVAATADAPQDIPASQLPPSLQPDRDLAPPAAPGSAQAEEAVRRHRELGMRIAGLRQEAERLAGRSSSLLGELRKLEVERELQETRAGQADASLSLIEGDLAVLEQRLGRAARRMTHMAREDSARLVGYRDLTVQLSDAERRLASRRAEAVELRASATQALDAARRAAAERRQVLARIAAERDQQLQVVDELERARQALDGAVAAYRPAATTADRKSTRLNS